MSSIVFIVTDLLHRAPITRLARVAAWASGPFAAVPGDLWLCRAALTVGGGGSQPEGIAKAEKGDLMSGQRKPRRVVAGVDGSPNSVAALRRAVAQARLRHADLDIVCIIPNDADAQAAAAALAMLHDSVARISPDGLDVPTRLRVERGQPATALLVVSAGAELLVIGARARSEHGNMFGGRTVPRCLEYAPCQVDICANHHERSSSPTRSK
jgi:nucleotide-binding universal stress UspA family protein